SFRPGVTAVVSTNATTPTDPWSKRDNRINVAESPLKSQSGHRWAMAPIRFQDATATCYIQVLGVGTTMRRREFIMLLGGAAVTWPHISHARQLPMPVVWLFECRSDPKRTFHFVAFDVTFGGKADMGWCSANVRF